MFVAHEIVVQARKVTISIHVSLYSLGSYCSSKYPSIHSTLSKYVKSHIINSKSEQKRVLDLNMFKIDFLPNHRMFGQVS